jgi:putative molybdopterin biosynthesis protein
MSVKLDYNFFIEPPLGAPYGELQLQNALFTMLAAVRETGSIGKAAERLGLSYRHLWGALKKQEVVFGQPLLNGVQGQAARLSEFGERFLWAEQRMLARVTPQAESLASQLDRELMLVIDPCLQSIAVCASHDVLLGALRDRLRRHSRLLLDFDYVGGSVALERLNDERCQIAGIHLPLSDEWLCRRGSAIHSGIGRFLRLGEHKMIRFAWREQGLIVPAGNPQGLQKIDDLLRPGVALVNRDAKSGSRLLFDELLQHARIAPELVAGYRNEEPTHLAVGVTVASGAANCGFGLRTVAQRFGLGFIPLVNEQYFVVCRKASLDSLALQALIDVIKSENFRRLIDAVPGYSSKDSGEIVSLRKTLPWYK